MDNRETKNLLDTYIIKLFQQRLGNILILEAFLFLFLGVMDYLYRSGNFNKPTIYLFASSPLFAILYPLNRRKLNKRYQYAILIIATTLMEAWK